MEAEPGQPDRSARRSRAALAAAIFVIGCFVGWPTLEGDFLSGDDVHLVLNHVLVNHPSLAHAFELVRIVHRDLYQPVPMLSFSLDFVTIRLLGLTPAASGPDAGAWVFHLTNVLIHAAGGVLVFWLFARLSGDRAVATVAAMLFLLHPYAAEVVGWLNGRMMLLATLFSLASLIAVDSFLIRGRWWWALLALFFVVLAMTSKVRVGLPVLMLILPLARRRWPSRRWWVLWVAAGLITVGFTALNIVSTSTSEMFQGAAEKLQGSRIARTVLVLTWYFQHYVVPVKMSPWHPPELLVLWSHPGIPAGLITLVLVGVVAAWSWRYTRVGVLGLLWFLATVATTLPLIPSRDVMAADRYVYLPNVGLYWLTAALLVQVVRWAQGRFNRPAIGHLAAGLGVVAGAAMVPYTWHVQSYYLSSLAKARRIAEVYPEEPGVWEDVGWAHYREGRYEPAIAAARIEIQKHPGKQACEPLQLVGMAQYRAGRVEEGIATLYQAVEADPEYGKCYSRLGHIYYELERYLEAEANYVRAVEIMPEYLPAIQALGHLYRRMGRLDQAVRWFERGLELNDFDPVSTMALAEIEMERGQTASAIERFKRLLDWQPENNVARTNLGVCYVRTGRTADAVKAYQEVLEREPGAVTAAINLANLLIDLGDVTGTIALVEQACGHAPTERPVLVAGHDLLVRLDRLREAATIWATALGREPQAADLAAWYAWTSALAGQWQPARDGARSALQGDPGQSLALAALVLAELAADHPDEADGYLDRFVATAPTPPDARPRLENALAQIGHDAPDDPWPYYAVARLLIADGETAAARRAVEEFVRLCPDPSWCQRASELLPSD